MAPCTNIHQIWSRLTKKTLLLMAILAILATACSGSADTVTDAADEAFDTANEVESAVSGDDGAAAEAFEDEEEAFEADEVLADDVAGVAPRATPATQTATGSSAASQIPTDLGRDIIFTAVVEVRVDDVATTGRQATEVITNLGGFVFGEESQGGAEPQTTLTFKVRPEDFSTALDQLSGIGELTSQRITTDDVTERVVDLQSRIDTTELGVERLRNAMEATTNLEDFARLEEQLLNRESDLEVLRGTLRTLRDRIDLATITLTVSQDRVQNGIEVATSRYEGHDAGIGCPGQGRDALDPGDEATICFEVINVGDQSLTNVTLTDTVLGLDADDLTVVFGDTTDLQPGQSVMFAYDLVADRALNLRVSVLGTPTNGTDTEAAGPVVRTSLTPRIPVDQSQVSAGFGDGFDAGAALLARIWATVVVLAGFLLPLLILLPVLWLFVKGIGAFRRRRTPPTPPAPTASGPGNGTNGTAEGPGDGDGGDDGSDSQPMPPAPNLVGA